MGKHSNTFHANGNMLLQWITPLFHPYGDTKIINTMSEEELM
jgi:hypothetical protein